MSAFLLKNKINLYLCSLLMISLSVNLIVVYKIYLHDQPTTLKGNQISRSRYEYNTRENGFEIISVREAISLSYDKIYQFKSGDTFAFIKLDKPVDLRSKFEIRIFHDGFLVKGGNGILFENYQIDELKKSSEIIDLGSSLLIDFRDFPSLEWSYRDQNSYYLYSDTEISYKPVNGWPVVLSD